MISKMLRFCLLSIVCMQFLHARDVLLEFKGAYFLPHACFKNIYKGGALYGPELTGQLCEDNEHWYGFASIDGFSKHGRSIGMCLPTRATLIQLAFGLKYFVPFCYGNFYLGLGVEPVYLKTKNCLPDGIVSTSKWSCGGIAKIGTYLDLPYCDDWFIDLFIDYSFAKVGCPFKCADIEVPLKANVSGAIFGGGLGYRF